MFKLEKLILRSLEGEEFNYTFSAGINYLQGKNDSGKTEFYNFIDFMLGSRYEIKGIRWYAKLDQAELHLTMNNITYKLIRTRDLNINYFSYIDERDTNEINKEEYRNRLMSVFSPKEEELRKLREFINEDITYRAFTLFNFLGENGQGVTNDFFDKCSDIKYSLRMSSILNFIFNNNLEKISKLKKELEKLVADVKQAEKDLETNLFISKRVNTLIYELGIKKRFDGNNHLEIKTQLDNILKMVEMPNKDKTNIAELEMFYNTLTEQIKEYDKMIQDSKQIENDNYNRSLLIENLRELIKDKPNYTYLITPMMETLEELKNSISFSKYVRQDRVINKLKEQREEVKKEIYRQNSKYKIYNVNEKTEKIIILKDLLTQENDTVNVDEVLKKKKRISDIKKELQLLQNSEDFNKINNISNLMTTLYSSSSKVSDISETDFKNEGFCLKYIKKGNSIQAVIYNEKGEENIFYIGSMARHTMMQLCGYLSFLILMIKENKYPLIPILVLDHISKQFDQQNGKAVGLILDKVYELIDKNDLQIFIFDDKSFESLGIKADHSECLLNENKTGFIPFYKPVD